MYRKQELKSEKEMNLINYYLRLWVLGAGRNSAVITDIKFSETDNTITEITVWVDDKEEITLTRRQLETPDLRARIPQCTEIEILSIEENIAGFDVRYKYQTFEFTYTWLKVLLANSAFHRHDLEHILMSQCMHRLYRELLKERKK